MQRSKIEWTDYTWNPITGCTEGCAYCYARKMANNPYYKKAFPFKFEPHFYPERMKIPSKYPDGSKVFVCSMAELFGDNPEWTQQVMDVIKLYPKLTFQLLTKRPENLIRWSPFPPNCWVLVSTTNTQMFHNACYYLDTVDAKVKGISYEPFYEWSDDGFQVRRMETLNWLIIGSQTQPVRHPPREWVDEIISAADKARIPVFVKEPMASHFGIDRREYPNANRN